MNTKLLKHARELWSVKDVSRETNRANALKWSRSVNRLGDRWVFAKLIDAKPDQPPAQPSLLDKWLLAKKVERMQ